MTSPINQSMTPAQWALLFLLSMLWGGSFLFNAVAVRELPPLTVVTLRLLLSALILAASTRALGVRLPRQPKVWAGFAVLGLFNNAVPFTLFVWSQLYITAGLASILNATQPLFTVFIAHLMTRDERITLGRFLGAVVGLAGVAAMIGADAFAGFNTGVMAQLACLAATMLYAFTAVFARRLTGIPPLAVATGQLTTAGLLMVPVALVVDQPWTLAHPGMDAIGAICAQALLSTALAYVVFFHLIAKAGAMNAGLVTFLNPVTAIVLGILFLGEQLAPAQAFGLAVIGFGLALIDGRPVRALMARFTSR